VRLFFVLVPGTGSLNPYSHRVGAAAVSDSEVAFFSDDESDEDDWEEDDVLPEEGPEVIDPPATNNGVEGCGEQVGRRAVDMSRDEDEYVDIEGMSDSEVVFFSNDESDEDDWEEDDVLPEEGPEVVDPPPTNGVERCGCGEHVGGRAVDMSTDEDEYVDILGMSDSEEHDYDGEVVD
jgi:hypothetical protein